MAKTSSLPQLSKLAELKSRIIFLLLALAVYRLGAHITVPGIDIDVLAESLKQQDSNGGISAMINMFSGGAFSKRSIFMLGVMPYITASIFIQILSVIYPPLEQLKKEGQTGRRKMTQYTRYLTLVLATAQGSLFALGLQSGSLGSAALIVNPGLTFVVWAVLTWVTGTVFLMWLGEQITERGVGNGISMLIFASIVSSIPGGVIHLFDQVRTSQVNLFVALFIVFLAFAVVAFVVFVERALRKITISYARKQQGRMMSAGNQVSHLPLKLNMAGVIPAIFGSALIAFILTGAQMISRINVESLPWFLAWLPKSGEKISLYMGQGQPLYLLLFASLIIFFCFFYTALQFNSKETSENLKRSGAFLPGIRPGIHTSNYLDKVLTRITLWGALYMTFICLMPEVLNRLLGLQIYLGGTSVLITVVVVMDLIAQVQSHIMSHQYESLMKKTNISSSLSNNIGL